MGVINLQLVCLFVITFFASSIYSLMAPFFPREVEPRGLSIKQIGFVFSAFPIAGFLTAPIHGYTGSNGGCPIRTALAFSDAT